MQAGDNVIEASQGRGVAAVSVYGNGGDDVFDIDLAGYPPVFGATPNAVTLDGGGGVDAVDYRTNPCAFVHLYQTRITASGGVPVYTYGLAERVNLNGTDQGEWFVIWETHPAVTSTVKAGDGNDQVHVGGAFDFSIVLDHIRGPLTVNGQGGGDVLSFNDYSATQPHAYVAAATGVTRDGMMPVSYATVERVELHGGIAGDTFDVHDSVPATTVVVDGQAGDDTVNVNAPAAPRPRPASGRRRTWRRCACSTGGGA